MAGVEPIPLNSLADFKRVLGLGRDRVIAMHAAGAPIAIDLDAKGHVCGYSADYHELQAWRVAQSKKEAA